ncbi:hypothetical protein [Streptosporangium sp. NPDC002524]|uniref:hypothetical protein n=1 Tax=Streptosporangium sp. NPDC002524 TaxID=3154537 RepID=UPI00332DE2BF
MCERGGSDPLAPTVQEDTMISTATAPPAPRFGRAALRAARPVLAGLGYVEAPTTARRDLRLLIVEALGAGDVALCERCHARISADLHRATSGESFALCGACA